MSNALIHERSGTSTGMRVDLYALERDVRRILRVGTSIHQVGLARRLWKLTATDMQEGRGAMLEDLIVKRRTHRLAGRMAAAASAR